MFLENDLFEKVIKKKCIFKGAIFENVFCEGAIPNISFLREKFLECISLREQV